MLQLVRGRPHHFKSLRTFRVGGVRVSADDLVMFDGHEMTVEGLGTVIVPQLKGAVELGWLVEVLV